MVNKHVKYVQSATIYVWERGQPLEIQSMLMALGGVLPPALEELAAHRTGSPMFCTPDFHVFSVTKKMNEEYQRLASFMKNVSYHRGFSTPLIEKRLAEHGLIIPDHELTFCQRKVDYAIGLNLDKIAGAAAYLELTQRHKVLAVPGTSIEQDQLYASSEIAAKLDMNAVPAE